MTRATTPPGRLLAPIPTTRGSAATGRVQTWIATTCSPAATGRIQARIATTHAPAAAARPQARIATTRTAAAGQATVELVGLLPLLAAVALAAFTVLAAQRAQEEAAGAAEAGAIALLQSRDPDAAARAAAPRHRTHVTVDGHHVTVTVRPQVPLLATRLTATATADAGRDPTP